MQGNESFRNASIHQRRMRFNCSDEWHGILAKRRQNVIAVLVAPFRWKWPFEKGNAIEIGKARFGLVPGPATAQERDHFAGFPSDGCGNCRLATAASLVPIDV